MRLKCLIIEDQLPAQRILRTYLDEIPELELMGSFTSPVEALGHLKTYDIQLIFLDIHLPKISGLNFIRSLKNPPGIIITSAYPEHALEGFELNVIDYLLKPFSFERFFRAVNKVIQPGPRPLENRIVTTTPDHIFIKVDKSMQRIDLGELLYIKSDGDYVWLVSTTRKHFVQQSLKYWQGELMANFLRIHKSYLVNLKAIDKIEGNEVVIRETRLPIGRMYKDMLLKKIGELLK
jgi:two-component system, LytTR family, response regulator LytT